MSARCFSAVGVSLACAVLCGSVAQAQTKIACVGASTTRGSGAAAGQSYPDQLGRLLGSGYAVSNFGLSSATMLKKGNPSFWSSAEFRRATELGPHIVVIWLGGADSKAENWDRYKSEFLGDYKAMIKHFQDLPSRPRVIGLMSVAMRDDSGVRKAIVEAEVQPLQRQAAADSGIPFVDLWAVAGSHPEYFADGVHMNNVGYGAVARAVQAVIVAAPVDGGAGPSDAAAAAPDGASPSTPDAGVDRLTGSADAPVSVSADAANAPLALDAGSSPSDDDSDQDDDDGDTSSTRSASGGGCSVSARPATRVAYFLAGMAALLVLGRRRRRS